MTDTGTRLGAEELIRRADELVPVLARRAAETETVRQVPDETIADLRAAGLIRVGNPERYGGYGLDVDTMFEVGWRLAQGCPSTGWVYTVSQVHNWQAGMADERAQEEYFASPDVISCSSFAPTGQVEYLEDGWRISGRWTFSSGVDKADWALLGGFVDRPGGTLGLFMVPRDDIAIHDDWFVSGLRGTGSKTVVIDEPTFVPRHRVIPLGGNEDGPWRDVHARGSYAAPILSIISYCIVTPVVGAAQGAIDAYAELLRKKVNPFTGRSAAEAPGPQFRVAESAAEADAALAILRANLLDAIGRGTSRAGFTPLVRARYRRDHAYAAKLAVSATNRVFDAAGGSALFDSHPLQRFHRDVNAGSHQIGLLWDDYAELYGRVRLGAEPSPAIW